MRAILVSESSKDAEDVASALDEAGMDAELLDVPSAADAAALARTFESVERVLGKVRAEAVVTAGSGDGVLAAVITAVKRGLPVVAFAPEGFGSGRSRQARAIERLAIASIRDAKALAPRIQALES